MKQVRETAAGSSIAAWIILNKKGKQVATVHAYYTNSGGVWVDVYDHAAGLQQGRAGGYGYDKFTAALSGLVIDGHEMTDHCCSEGVPKVPRGRSTYPRDFKVKKGYTLANYVRGDRVDAGGHRVYPNIPEDEEGYTSCFRIHGLDYLHALGYKVYQVI